MVEWGASVASRPPLGAIATERTLTTAPTWTSWGSGVGPGGTDGMESVLWRVGGVGGCGK